LAAIQGLEATSPGATAVRGSILALFYCLGLGIPFVIAALATEWMATASGWLRRHQRVIGQIGGILLIVIGVLEITGAWQTFVLWLQTHVPASNAIL
jgi:cytochrome c-type biogenesis protein